MIPYSDFESFEIVLSLQKNLFEKLELLSCLCGNLMMFGRFHDLIPES